MNAMNAGSKPIACAVIGAMGRMGQLICKIISASESFVLAGATESPGSTFLGKSLRETTGLPEDGVRLVAAPEDISRPFDVVIDFTFPEVSLHTARFAHRAGKPAVIGTTGFSAEQRETIAGLSAEFPCVCAPNMSIGVNTLFKAVRDVALTLREGFDVEIMEIHHRYKKDAPSGTALQLARIIADAYGRDLEQTGVYQRKGFTGERKSDEIGIQALRAGDVVGEHLVLFGGRGERLELVHRAQSRDCFAQGALYAARWVMDKPNGLYDMQDVLGLKGS